MLSCPRVTQHIHPSLRDLNADGYSHEHVWVSHLHIEEQIAKRARVVTAVALGRGLVGGVHVIYLGGGSGSGLLLLLLLLLVVRGCGSGGKVKFGSSSAGGRR